jgi:hypothetical protein
MSGESSTNSGNRQLNKMLVSSLFMNLTPVSAGSAPRKTTAGESIGYQPTKTKVKYYSPSPQWRDNDVKRISMLAALIRWPVTNKEFQTGDVSCWIYSSLDFAFPGLSHSVLNQDPMVEIEREVITDEFVTRRIKGEEIPEAEEEKLPGLLIDPLCVSAEWLHAIGALTVLLYTMGKSPNEDNLTAFTVNRPAAIAGKMGIDVDQSSPMSAARLPALRDFKWFCGHFNMNYNQRSSLARILLSWTGLSALTPDQTVVATQISLWKGAGLTHLSLVSDFLCNFGDAVVLIDGLKNEIRVYVQSFIEYSGSSDNERDFLRVIDGDRARLGRSREYINLLNLARGLASVIDPRFKNYAPSLGESPYKEIFIEKCKATGLSLPSRYKNSSIEGETGGGVIRSR